MADLDPGLAALRDAGAARGLAPMVEITPTEARERITAGHRLCSAGPADVEVEDLTVEHGGLVVPVRRYADASDSGVVLVYVHGGGWVTGDLGYSDELCRFLAAAAGCTVVSVDYRLAPEHRFPAGLDDVAAVLAWAADQDGTQVLAVGGDSAGANLAVAALLRRVRTGERLPAFQVLLYPALDHDFTTDSYLSSAHAFPIGAADMEWFFDHYVDPTERDRPEVSPLRSPDLGALPRTHVVTVGHDPLRDDGRGLVAALEKAGTEVGHDDFPTLCHGFLRFTAASPAAAGARDAIVATVAELVLAAREEVVACTELTER